MNTRIDQLKDNIRENYNFNKNVTYLHFGDGDYYFLTGQSIGSATPGRRALKKEYKDIDLEPFKNGVLQNDYICMEYHEKEMIKNFNKLFPNRDLDFDLTWIYELVINKWIFNFDSIGLIGAKPKLKLIKKLMEYGLYKDYLGIKNFNDYIEVPQKYLADNLQGNINLIGEQLKKAKSKLFLYGIGHAKTGISYTFKQFRNAVYLDIGAGIDAIAGCYEPDRPFGKQWINYRIKNYDYSDIDYLNYYETEKDVWLS